MWCSEKQIWKRPFSWQKERLFAYVNSSPTGIQTLVKIGKLVYDKQAIANILNKQFELAFTNLETQTSSVLNVRTKEKFDNIKITSKAVFDLLTRESSTTNLLESIDVLTHLNAKKLQADVVFLDFPKELSTTQVYYRNSYRNLQN